MSLSEELTRLQSLHDDGVLTDAEFAEAKTTVLAGRTADAPPSGEMQQELERLKIQNAMIQLDQEWQSEREDYMIRGRYGSRSLPTQGGSLGGAVVLGLMSLFAVSVSGSARDGGFLAAVGVVFFVVSIWIGVSGSAKASRYEAALEEYGQRRRELEAQLSRPR